MTIQIYKGAQKYFIKKNYKSLTYSPTEYNTKIHKGKNLSQKSQEN